MHRALVLLGVLLIGNACGGSTERDPGTGGSGGAGAGGTAGGVGGSGGSVAGSGGVGGATGGSGGATGGSGGISDCALMSKQYAELLSAAKACNPSIFIDQCTAQVSDGLICSCPTSVNKQNADELEALKKLAAAANAQGCHDGIVCGACPPPPTDPGACVGAGEDGSCEDFFGP